MQLPQGAGTPPRSEDLAEALRAAAERFGHRPAITVLRPDRRDEQGFASLAKWASKGAHLLELEALLDPGDRLRLHSPVDWPAVAVCLAAWWVGVHVTTDGDASVTVAHGSSRPPDGAGEVYSLGDAADGSPTEPGTDEPWAIAVQTFPDRPPAPRSRPELVAASARDVSWTHRELLSAAAGWDVDGPIGVQRDDPPAAWLPAVVRPFVTGHRTVVLAGAAREAAIREGVQDWA